MFDSSWNSAMQQMGFGSCDGCQFWSECICTIEDDGTTLAMCLNCESRFCDKMVYGGCECHTPGRAIDDPSR